MNISRFEVRDRIALLTIDNPPVNALSQRVRADLVEAITRLAGDGGVDALVVACDGRTFIAGADIREFGKPSLEPLLTTVVDAIEASAKPVIAAIHGTALGGGLEVAMACHYRVAVADAKLGLPEVKLGLMPGARGTQYLPRLVGVPQALEMIAFGNPIGAEEGLRIALIDRLAKGDLVADAVAFAKTVAQIPPPRTSKRTVPPVPPTLWDEFASANARKFRSLDAPPAIIRAVRAAVELPFDEGAALERSLFLELRAGPQNEALRHVFFAEREAAKVPGLDGVTPRPIERIGVVGAGTMGTGITIAFLLAGFPVTLVEKSETVLTRGSDSIRTTIENNMAGGRTPPERGRRALASLATSLDYAALAQVDLIVEAAFETMEVKREIFAALDRVAKPGAILATNTSYLDVDAIAAATSRPGDVLGLHFFSPANIMKLLEIVRGSGTAPDVLATAQGLAKRIGKVAVVAGNAYGFIGNRMLAVRRQEAEAMVLEGVSPYEIDRVLEQFGFPMGPFKIGDLAGLDLGWSPETSTGATIRERLCEAGRRGQKAGAGFYDYDERRRPSPSPVVEDIVASLAADRGVARRSLTDDEILARSLWPMIDEGARLLDEGIALRASDIDVVWLNGYGWPAWTGGPMFYAERTGLTNVVADLRRIGREPSALLTELAEKGHGFAARDRAA